MSSSSTSLTLFFFFFFFASTFLYAHAFNITTILNQNNHFTIFNKLLSQTGLASTINTRPTVTVLALANDAVSSFTDESTEDNKKTLSLLILLDYYDIKKLRSLNKRSALLTTLFQSSGQAKGQQGFINATVLNNGDVMFGSGVRGSGLEVKLLGSLASEPHISVLHVSSYIPIMMAKPSDTPYGSNTPLPPQPPGDDDYEYDEPPSPPSSTKKPVVAAATAATAKPPAKAEPTSGVSAIRSQFGLAFVLMMSSFWLFMTVW